MINNYLKTAFPVYDRLEKQFRFKLGASNQYCLFRLFSGLSFILPFQIRKVYIDDDQIISWSIHRLDGSIAFNLNQNIDIFIKNIDGLFENWIYDGRDLEFKYNNGLTSALALCDGQFYSVIEFQSGQKFYTEIFEVDSQLDMSDLITLEWRGHCHIAGIDYSTAYKNRLFIDAVLERNTPSILEEGEDIEGTFIPTFIKYINRYRISFIAPDWLVESLTILSLHVDVTISTNKDLYTAALQNVKIENLEWLNPPCYARLDLVFEQEEGAIYTTCCNQ